MFVSAQPSLAHLVFAERREWETKLGAAEAEIDALQRRIAQSKNDQEQLRVLMNVREEEERNLRIDIIQRDAAKNLKNRHLSACPRGHEWACVRMCISACLRAYDAAAGQAADANGHSCAQCATDKGWSQWAGQYKKQKADQRAAQIYREAHQRLMRPGLAKGFIQWRGLWQSTRRKLKAEAELNADEILEEEKKLRLKADEEAGRCRSSLVEKEQALSLANIALDDERKALVVARTEAAEAKVTAMQLRDSTTKLAAVQVRERQLQQRLDQLQKEVDRERSEIKKMADQHKGAAEKELTRLLAEQRKSLEAQMALVQAEAEERIRLAEERLERELRALAEQRREQPSRAPSPQPEQMEGEDAQLVKQRVLSKLHPVWARGPDLNTADRAVAWEQWAKERENQKPPEWPLGQTQRSAEAYRAARRQSGALSGRRPSPEMGVPGMQPMLPLPNGSSQRGSARGDPSPGRLRASSSTGILLTGSTSIVQPGTTFHPLASQ